MPCDAAAMPIDTAAMPCDIAAMPFDSATLPGDITAVTWCRPLASWRHAVLICDSEAVP